MHVRWTLCQALYIPNRPAKSPTLYIQHVCMHPSHLNRPAKSPTLHVHTACMHAPLSPEQTSKEPHPACTYSMQAPLSPEQTSKPCMYIQHACTPLTWTDQQTLHVHTACMHPSHLNRPAKSPTLQLQWEPLRTNPSRDAAWSSRYEKRDDNNYSVRSILSTYNSNSYLDVWAMKRKAMHGGEFLQSVGCLAINYLR